MARGGIGGGGSIFVVYAYNIMFIPCLRSDAVSSMSAHLLSHIFPRVFSPSILASQMLLHLWLSWFQKKAS